MTTERINPLGVDKINSLLFRFAVPSIIGMLVSALYNIVDQIFIGRGVGIIGNAATNVSFPLTTICTALGLLLGIGGASGFNLELGAGRSEKAGKIAGSAICTMAIGGVIIAIIVKIFLLPLMLAFGASSEALPYALTYTRITSFGFPFLVVSIGTSSIIRSDGKPVYSMLCMLVGAVINTILDPLFIFVFDMGIAGAAWATVISQIISFGFSVAYLFRFQSVELKRSYFKPQYLKLIASLGAASCFNQLAMFVVQIAMNNTLTHYGALSVYGEDIPLACVGVITKVNVIFISFVVGLSQGTQPIIGFNYGAKNYERVKETYFQAVKVATIMSVIAFLCFQIFPRQIISLFGQGNELYYQFAVRYFRIFMLFTFINGVQPATANFFTSIGKAKRGMLVSLTRQFLFLLPLILIFPLFLGIDGIMYAGPIADCASVILALFLVRIEMGKIDGLILEESVNTSA